MLEDALATVFPGTGFIGIMPRGGVTSPRSKDFYFLIDRDGRVYDLAEMSSGEQAVFPLVYEFVRLDIKRSVVLIKGESVPIAKLLIEGKLEAEMLTPILQGSPVLQRGGSKNSLRPRTLAERQDNKVAAGYLRDRDFDFDPPPDTTA